MKEEKKKGIATEDVQPMVSVAWRFLKELASLLRSGG